MSSPSLSQDSTLEEEETITSSVPAGTPLKGLNYFKTKDPPLAMEDKDYPSWLWTLLDNELDSKAADGVEEGGDLYSKSKKQRKLAASAAKKAAKAALLNPLLLEPKVPIDQQSIDLPAGDGSIQGAMQAAMARQELTEAMRQRRRKGIKEGNFLKAMG